MKLQFDGYNVNKKNQDRYVFVKIIPKFKKGFQNVQNNISSKGRIHCNLGQNSPWWQT